MTARNRKTRKSQPASRHSGNGINLEVHSGALPSQERQIMAENDVEIRFFRLTRRQQAALPVVAVAPTIAQAATDSGVSQRTLYRWFKNPDFRDAVSSFLHECSNLGLQHIQAQTLMAASVFADVMQGPDQALRLRAARYSGSLALRIRESEQIAADVRDIKEALDLNNT
ncbi:MAG: hypothetical protein F4X66_03875 [Chloroflexi bacterium]|nr:hypothetical protein [Chloroflexota bacterium]